MTDMMILQDMIQRRGLRPVVDLLAATIRLMVTDGMVIPHGEIGAISAEDAETAACNISSDLY